MPAADQPLPVTDAEAAHLFADLATCRVVVLAVSGGPDSTALCLLAARWRASRTEGPVLRAITIDHGLRPEAREEAAAVQRFAAALGVGHHTLPWEGPKPAAGLQEAARAARYRLLAQEARRVGAHHVITAHTLDDQAETVLFRLARGSGLSGLAGMARVSPLPVSETTEPAHSPSRVAWLRAPPRSRKGFGEGDEGLTRDDTVRAGFDPPLLLVRPFLDLPKARLIATLVAAGVPYADDRSNRDPRFARPRLRTIMPVLAGEGLTPARLAQLARRARRADAAIEAAVDHLAAALVPPLDRAPASGVSAFSLSAAEWLAAPSEIRLRLLGRLIALTGDEGLVELGKLERCEQALAAGLYGRPPERLRRTLAGALVTLAGGRLTVERAPPRRKSTSARERGVSLQADAGSIHQPSAK